MARNRRKAADHDRKDGLDGIEENYLMQQGRHSEIARQAAEHQQRQQQLPGTGKMLLHYFLAGIGVTVGFIIIGVALRAVGLESGAAASHHSASSSLELHVPADEEARAKAPARDILGVQSNDSQAL